MTRKSGNIITVCNKNGDMGKEERQRAVLGLLVESDLDLPPNVILNNLDKHGLDLGRRTVNRYLKQLSENGYVETVDGTDGHYTATESGKEYYYSHQY